MAFGVTLQGLFLAVVAFFAGLWWQRRKTAPRTY